MPKTRCSEDTTGPVDAAKTADGTSPQICESSDDPAPQLIARVEALRASLRKVIDHANQALDASQAARQAGYERYCNHIRRIESSDYAMNLNLHAMAVVPLEKPAPPDANTRHRPPAA